MQTTLVLLAAGKGTRYGGLKQLEGFGPNGELMMDYSIADAVTAGFSRVVLVVRREHQEMFEEKMGRHALRERFELVYAFQEQPLGTADAARSAASVVHEPAAIINADDYYGGVEIYHLAQRFLQSCSPQDQPARYALLGYPLGDTLSPHGRVARGICKVDENNSLLHLEEHFELGRDERGTILGKNGHGDTVTLPEDTMSSMAFWMLPPSFMVEVEKDFQEYVQRPRLEGRAGEFLLTTVIEDQRQSGRAEVSVLRVPKSEWCGITSPGDRESVVALLGAYHANGRYGKLRLPS